MTSASKTKLFFIVSWSARCIIIVAAGFVAGLMGYWINDRDLPIVTEAAEVLNTVRPGDELQIKWTVHRWRSCYATVTSTLQDSKGNRKLFPQRDVPTPMGPLGREVFVSSIPIPAGFEQGRAFYRLARSYYCNPLHLLNWPVTEQLPDIHFEITGQPVPAAPVQVIPR